MLERLPEHAELIDRGNAEHEAVLGRLEAAEDALASWRAEPSDASRAALLGALDGLGERLIEHLDHEEADVVPLIGQCIDVAEWGAMSANAFQRFSGDKPWLAIGLIQEQLLPTENATMEANMPPPVHDFWVRTGADVRGVRRHAEVLNARRVATSSTPRCSWCDAELPPPPRLAPSVQRRVCQELKPRDVSPTPRCDEFNAGRRSQAMKPWPSALK